MSRNKSHEDEIVITDEGDETDKPVAPEDDTDVQIIPVSDTEKKEGETEKDRQAIYDILKSGVGLPWVHPPKITRGQA